MSEAESTNSEQDWSILRLSWTSFDKIRAGGRLGDWRRAWRRAILRRVRRRVRWPGGVPVSRDIPSSVFQWKGQMRGLTEANVAMGRR